MFTATWTQAISYLCGVCLFSISFLVFLNSSVSFVITDILKKQEGVGDAVGTLGFADEIVALVACPLWGMASDRIGVRTVSLRLQLLPLRPPSLVVFRTMYARLRIGRLPFQGSCLPSSCEGVIFRSKSTTWRAVLTRYSYRSACSDMSLSGSRCSYSFKHVMYTRSYCSRDCSSVSEGRLPRPW